MMKDKRVPGRSILPVHPDMSPWSAIEFTTHPKTVDCRLYPANGYMEVGWSRDGGDFFGAPARTHVAHKELTVIWLPILFSDHRIAGSPDTAGRNKEPAACYLFERLSDGSDRLRLGQA
jgi:hypothetical protein